MTDEYKKLAERSKAAQIRRKKQAKHIADSYTMDRIAVIKKRCRG